MLFRSINILDVRRLLTMRKTKAAIISTTATPAKPINKNSNSGVIFIYLVVTVLTYLTKDRIAVYEVREGSILKNTSFTCIALRDENLVYADQEGYVNYFVEAGQKVAVGNNVYTLSTNKIADTSSTESNDEVDLSTDEWNSILMKVQSFHENFRLQNFKDVRVLKEETTALLQRDRKSVV